MGANILLVEDTPHNLDLMTYLLQAQGHMIAAASAGEEAIRLARQAMPDLVIMDIQLGGEIDGFEALRQIRSHKPLATVPVVAVTAFAMVGDREQALAAGFTDYLTKPIDPHTFATSIDRHLPVALRGVPLGERAAPPPARAPATPAAAGRPGQASDRETILVVDDVPTNVELMRSILESSGYQVRAASTIDEALDLARTVRPELILSDVHIGPESGLHLLRELRDSPDLAGIGFALTTATAAVQDLVEINATTEVQIVRRPIEPQDLLSRVASLLQATRSVD
jgi:two-component system, cell cycle response regulator